MNKNNLWLLEAIIWFFFVYYLLYSIKTPGINLWTSSLILLALGSAGIMACPWIRLFTEHLKNSRGK